MAPVDPRLWRRSAPARTYLVVSVVLTVVTTVAIVVTAVTTGSIVAGVITDPARRTVGAWTTQLAVLVGALAVRAGAAWLQARYAQRSSARVVAELEGDLLDAAVRLPERDRARRHGELAVVLTKALADLRPYLSGYLPALIVALIVPPTVLAVIASYDLVSAAIVAVTLPLIPIFMILIGLLTRGRAQASLQTLSRLSEQVLDLIAGLPTLRALGRQDGPQDRIRTLGDAHRRSTMSALRIAFLSSMVLELLATLCVALVAVGIGMRLVFGDMPLDAAIVALILTPEVYHPLRTVGERFHAAEDGMAAAQRAFAVLDADRDIRTGAQRPDVPLGLVELDEVSVAARDGAAPYRLDAVLRPGRLTVLTGPNGSGKTTTLHAILGLIAPDSGRVLVDGVDVTRLDVEWWWTQVAWLPQQPAVLPGDLRDNLVLAAPGKELESACRATGFDRVLDSKPDRWQTRVGAGGAGLSLGERQRLGLARTLASQRPVLLLDEPTAHLDPHSAATVLKSLRALAERGATVVVVGHRPSVLAAADEIIEVRADA